MHEELLKKGVDSTIAYSSKKYNETPNITDTKLKEIIESKYDIKFFDEI